MLESLRILQIGDVHLPEWEEKRGPVDVKDASFSKDITNDIIPERLRGVLKRLHDLSVKDEVNCVAVMGDLTSWGEIEHLKPAVQIIDSLVKRPDGSQPTMIGVPGNHDVDKIAAASLGKAGKFHSISEAFEYFGWKRPPSDDCVSYTLSSASGRTIECMLVNTSIGSWSTHLFPDELAKEYLPEALSNPPVKITSSAMEDVGAATMPEADNVRNKSEQLFSQMDTPYLSKRSVSSISDRLQQTDGDTSIVVAHHNLLPQRIPRILPYGELLNGGYFRQLLHASNKNVIFLHGHVHEDPIEVIAVPNNDVSGREERKIVSISAPTIQDGFNEITLFFGAENDVFLVRVTKYRPNELNVVGNFSDQDTVYIPLKRHVNDLITGDARKVWQEIKERKYINWQELKPTALNLKLSDDNLEVILLKLFCCGLVKISQLGRPRTKWVMEYTN